MKPNDEAVRHAGRVVRAELRTTAPPDRVYAAFADPESLSHWFTEAARGSAAAPGGTMTWVFERFGLEVVLDVLVAEKGKRLVLRCEPPGSLPNVLEVTIEHEGKEGGRTLLRVVNSGFGDDAASDERRRGVDSGWAMALQVLRFYVERHFGERRLDFLAMRPARFDFAAAFARYTTTAGLRSWLAPDAATDGKTFSFTLGGRRLSGDVLVRTDFETALAAREVEGVFELKSIRTGPDAAALAVRASLWGADAAGRDALEREFGAALGRLAAALEAGD